MRSVSFMYDSRAGDYIYNSWKAVLSGTKGIAAVPHNAGTAGTGGKAGLTVPEGTGSQNRANGSSRRRM